MDSFNKLIYLFFLSIVTCSVSANEFTESRFYARNFAAMKRASATQAANANVARLLAGNSAISNLAYKGTTSKGLAVIVKKAVPTSKNVVAKIIKKKAFTPNGIAFLIAMEAAGWIRDELLKEFYKDMSDTSSGYCNIGGLMSLSQCVSTLQSNGYGTFQYFEWDSPYIDIQLGGRGSFYIAGLTASTAQDVIDGYNPSSSGLEYATPDDYIGMLPDINFNDDDLEDLLTNPTSYLPDSNTDPDDNPFPETETSPSMEEDPFRRVAIWLDDYFDRLNDTDPLNDPGVDPLFPPDPTIIDSVPAPVPTYVQDQPVFDLCAEYPNILACQELGEPDDPITIGEEEIPFDYTPVSLSGSAVCPSPTVFTLTNGNSYTLSNQPVCDFAVGINGIILMVCSMIGMYIISGGIRNG